MDQRPFDADFDRWLSAALVARPAAAPIDGLADRVLLQAVEQPLALGYARRLRRQRRWLWAFNAAAAAAIVGAIWFAAPGVWQSYQASVDAWTAVSATSITTTSTQTESSTAANSSDELLWFACATLLAAVIGLATTEALTGGSGWRSGRFLPGYR